MRCGTKSRSSQTPLVTQDHLACVILSSIVSRTAVAPLERLKILMQTESLTNKGKPNFRGIAQVCWDSHDTAEHV